MSNKKDCPLCGEVLEDEPAIHDVALCEKTERLKGRETIKQLKTSVVSWKDAWFQLRDIVSWLWWYHPAIDDDQQRDYYRKVSGKKMLPKQIDIIVDGKLVGSVTSPEAESAVRRLMSFPSKEDKK